MIGGHRILGVDRRSMACAAHPNGRIDYAVLLVERPDGSIKAYRGAGPDTWILDRGDPLRVAEAQAHFPWVLGTEPDAFWARYAS